MSKPYTFPSQALIICLSIATKNATTSLCHAPVRNESNKIRITNIVVAVVSATFALLRLGYKVISFGFEDLGYDDYAVLAATVMGVPTVVIIDRGIVPIRSHHQFCPLAIHSGVPVLPLDCNGQTHTAFLLLKDFPKAGHPKIAMGDHHIRRALRCGIRNHFNIPVPADQLLLGA
jgi:hypothetical protein